MPVTPRSLSGLDLPAGPADHRAKHHRQPGAATRRAVVGATLPHWVGRLAGWAQQDLMTLRDESRPRRGPLGGVRLSLAALHAGHTSSVVLRPGAGHT